jgi:hypothetical protein
MDTIRKEFKDINVTIAIEDSVRKEYLQGIGSLLK